MMYYFYEGLNEHDCWHDEAVHDPLRAPRPATSVEYDFGRIALVVVGIVAVAALAIRTAAPIRRSGKLSTATLE